MAERMVMCAKLKKELPGLDSPPIPGPVGKKVYENVSAEAWKMFEEHFIMVTNEYRLDLMDDSTNQIFFDQIDQFLFEGTAKPPEGFVPKES
ncbi:MAG: oxidative damage protection protein [Candidatus Eremiobacteraeota bacterium]|nr:oxidative damage protection protein [Candidatus Eremiobacteraeota bacterium]